MLDTQFPSLQNLKQAQTNRRRLVMGFMVLILALVFGVMLTVMRSTNEDRTTFVIGSGLVMLVCMAVPVAIWRNPRVGIHLLLIGVAMFPGIQINHSAHVLSENIPFWLNGSSIGEAFANTYAFKMLIISPAEGIMIVTFLAWIIRMVTGREERFEKGVFFWNIMLYGLVVFMGFVRGNLKHGDSTIALYEVRAQAQMLLVYILAVNLIRTKEHVKALLWVLTVSLGIQGLLALEGFFASGEVTPAGFMSHDQSLVLNLTLFIALLTVATRAEARLRWVALLSVPATAIALLGNQRRAGIGAFMIAFLPLMPILGSIVKSRRAQIAKLAVLLAIIGVPYIAAAWNGQGAWALPARAIRSQSEPNSRDASSDAYRYAENFDLKATRDTSPWIGIGFGQPFYQPIYLVELTTDFLKYIPHNSILWLWMRTGNLGFFCFWMLMAAVIIKGIHILKEIKDPELLTVGLLPIMFIIMLYIYGKYDLMLTVCRQTVALGLLVGILSNVKSIQDQLNTVPPSKTEADGILLDID